MKQFISFIKRNLFVLIFVFSGIIIGYIYWFNWGMYYGTLPLSSECWVNCTYGGIFGGLAGSLIKSS
ncbi:MAG: hypothetical protein LLF80_09880 [Porphyromonadaceae bacterium]|nr:hypothetical protein [Porphyromonadaceae bacterium]